ncbi:PQQ-binding-like beta-propeller repeat protein [Rhodopirellula sp. MGV]|uniref:outer membrane protein assembly factor BamB family protein n=1 Tax=Rhodopirellula sp. MGV TaxID=2023130 RepID=UPI000B9621EA|nr:PQQ-binding-like beta-propeller repeat protein [Rhodopirellula sp. MGV]OYP34718.1 pyrrolo-quinoline quinone [Rhodopirellula sp. MGV]PNY34327.1 pyrrolo-quinoline quinone [Rhodopirellula baltica]
MRLTRILPYVFSCLCCASVLHADQPASWPQWRGPHQNGVAGEGDYPATWSETENVRWKQTIDGRGGSTPVVADNKAFLTSGIDGKNVLLAYDLVDGGQLVWKADLGEDTKGKHKKGSGANPSAVTDGQHVFAYYRSGDLGCVDMSGNVVWQVNLQDEFIKDLLWWDLGSSPTLINDLVVIAVMQSPEENAANAPSDVSYLVAFDRKSGEKVWKVSRNLEAPREAGQSYTTPIAIPDRNMIAVMGADHLTIHSAKDGKELGRVGGFNPAQDQFFRSIASPIVSGDIVICPYSRGETITACRISDVIAGKGRDSIVWFRDDIGSDVPTPAVDGNTVYVTGDRGSRGNVTAVDVQTGETIWEFQLDKSRVDFSSSPLVANDHLYVTAENATTFVLGPLSATEPALVATNEVSDNDQFTVSSLVPVNGNSLLLRSRNSLYLFGKP